MPPDFVRFQTRLEPAAGTLIISAANMADPNFKRSVVLLCDHSEQGSFGLILNRKLSALELNDALLHLLDGNSPIYQGGPVQLNTLHFLHTCGDVPGSREIAGGVYWGGDFEKMSAMMRGGAIKASDVRFYVGYAGWGEGQLENEMQANSWYVMPASSNLIFHEENEDLWKKSVKALGSRFELLLNYPEDPSLN